MSLCEGSVPCHRFSDHRLLIVLRLESQARFDPGRIQPIVAAGKLHSESGEVVPDGKQVQNGGESVDETVGALRMAQSDPISAAMAFT